MSRIRYTDHTNPRAFAETDNPTDNAQPTDNVVTAQNHVATFTDSSNPTDDAASTGSDFGEELVSLSEVVAITRIVAPTDTTGNTDTPTFDRSVSTQDSEGLTDTAAKSITLVTPVDSEGLTDTSPLHFTKGPSDTLGITDDKTFNRTLGPVDNTGLDDEATPTTRIPTVPYSPPFTYDVGWRDVINIVDKTVEQRTLRDFEVVWSSTDLYHIPTNSTITIKAVAESNPFMDAIVPVEGIRNASEGLEFYTVVPEDADYVVEAGNSLNVFASLSRTSGQSTDIIIENTSAINPVTISNLRLRARPVVVARSTRMFNQDIDSIDVNGPKSFTETVGWANFNDVFALSEIVLNQRFRRLPVVHFEVSNGSDIRLRQSLEVKLSDRIRVVNFNTATENDFFVEQVEHHIQDSGNTHRTVIGCEQIPTPVLNPFTFNESGKGFDDGVFADRASGLNFDENLFILNESTLGSEKVLAL